VKYGALLDATRLEIAANRQPGGLEKFIRWLALEQLMPRPERLKMLAWLGRAYQRLGLAKLVSSLSFLPGFIHSLNDSIPPASLQARTVPGYTASLEGGRGNVAFFSGCIQEAFLGAVNAATLRVLRENGYTVHIPAGQTCCGAAHLHLADEKNARELARKNIAAFLKIEASQGFRFIAIINNAGGCGSQLKGYAHLLRDDPEYAAEAKRFSELTRDISEFLVEHEFKRPSGVIRARATYSDSCHLRHVQRVTSQPREIIRSIPGLELVELSHPELCCGSAGVYNFTQPKSAGEVLRMKMEDIEATRAELVIVTNTGCHLQLLHGASASANHPRVMHIVELLDESYRAASAKA
jgi:glycolate oxidase iron-sulfur subunit